MASKSGDINQIFEDIINDAENTARAAIKSASKNVQKDVLKKAKENLDYYYANYTPSIYRRTDRLKRAILPYYADRSNSKNIRIEVGVQYQSAALTGAYKSNSWYHQSGNRWIDRMDGSFNFNSPNNGVPEPDWILNNFLEGVHPRTDVTKTYDGRKAYKYNPKRDRKSQEELMVEFLETELPSVIDGYIMEAVLNEINSRL